MAPVQAPGSMVIKSGFRAGTGLVHSEAEMVRGEAHTDAELGGGISLGGAGPDSA